MKKFFTLLIVMLCMVSGFSQLTPPEEQVLIVPSRTETGFDFLESYLEANDAKIVQHYEQLNWYLVDLPAGQTQDMFIAMTKDLWFIEHVYKNVYMEYSRDNIPNDTQFGSQWHLRQLSDRDIDADSAWNEIPNNNIPTIVAVFDGGIDITHEDLVGNIVQPFNAVTNLPSNGELVDPVNDRHGTACSGTIAAVTNNNRGVSSVGNNKVLVKPINIMTSITSGGSFGTSTSIQVNAINSAIASGCVAISMSYGGASYDAALEAAFTQAKTQARGGKGLFICASTGNGFSGTITQYPASYSAVYGIGATTSSDLRAGFSNFGNIVDISAPGATILTTDLTGATGYNGGNYASVSGTSFSCPITAAAGALILYKNPSLTETQVMSILAQTAQKVGGYTYSFNPSYPAATRSNELGYGRINLNNALKLTPLVGNPILTPPSALHNITLANASLSSSSPSLGSTVTITVTQRTDTPNLSQVQSKLRYVLSSDNVWSADDLIIGGDTSTLGGGITSEVETINFTIPSNLPSSTRFVLIRANFDNAVSEFITFDNSVSLAVALVNPGATGLDLSALWNTTQLTTCNSSLGGQISCRFRNTGQVPINTFSFRWRWQDCATPNGCLVSSLSESIVTTILGSTVQPNQLTSTFTFGFSITSIPINSNRVLLCEILTVNGLPSDDFSGNNIAAVTINRISCTNSIGALDTNVENVGEAIVKLEEPKIMIFTVTGSLLDVTDTQYLAPGIYIVKYIFSDHVLTERISKNLN